MKRILITALTVAMAVIMAACGSGTAAPSSDTEAKASIDNAKDMFKAASEAMADKDSMHVNTDFDINMKMDMSGIEGTEDLGDGSTYEVPIGMKLDMDITASYAHGDVEYSMTFAGADSTMKGESYIDIKNGTSYMKESGTDDWIKSDDDFSIDSVTMGMNQLDAIDEKYLEDSEFKEADGEYIVTLPAEAINSMSFDNQLDEMGLGEDADGNIDISGGPVTYHFDAETNYLTSVELKDIKMKVDVNEDSQTYTVNCDLNSTMSLSKLGEISDRDVAIPEHIVNGAEDEDDTEVDVDLDDLTED